MRILVTGGAGFIGSHLVEALMAQGRQVVVVDDLSSGQVANLPQGVLLYQCDICSPQLARPFREHHFEAVVHCAAQVGVLSSVENPLHDLRVNVVGTAKVVAQCRRRQVSKIVFLSSGGAIYGEAPRPVGEEAPVAPKSYYGVHKYCAEQYVRFSGLPYAILRLANVYGPRQREDLEGGVVAIFLERLRRRQPITIYGDGEQSRDFIYVKDVATAVLAALDYPGRDLWNIGTGRATTINHLLHLLTAELGPPVQVNYEPFQPAEIYHSCLDISKILATGSWAPQYSLEQGLQQLIEESNLRPGGQRR